MSEVDQMPAMEKDTKQMYVFEAEESKTRPTGTNSKISESGKNIATDLVNKVTSLLKPKNPSRDARALNPAKELSE